MKFVKNKLYDKIRRRKNSYCLLFQNAVLCAVPFLTLWVFMIVLGKSFDMLELRGILSHTAVRKVATGFGKISALELIIYKQFCQTDNNFKFLPIYIKNSEI